jgi:hypothetical protein
MRGSNSRFILENKLTRYRSWESKTRNWSKSYLRRHWRLMTSCWTCQRMKSKNLMIVTQVGSKASHQRMREISIIGLLDITREPQAVSSLQILLRTINSTKRRRTLMRSRELLMSLMDWSKAYKMKTDRETNQWAWSQFKNSQCWSKRWQCLNIITNS